ncbi:phosphate butyryltransferase [Bacillus marinisedimentorum]|uniref:phosphate butyryltransferase n=1 Tax=Bacillus marinisedimentorum TaxID=1821260 RepID=UPI0007DF8E65|nr:phosphate butyryltransferase [Bacillus marinisedimentorum]
MKLKDLVDKAKTFGNVKVAVAAAEDSSVLEAVARALGEGLASFQLFGDEKRITELIKTMPSDENMFKHGAEIIDCPTQTDAARRAVASVSSGNAQIVMKGMVPTAILLKAVLHKEYGLRSNNILSHVAVFEFPDRDKLLFLTDSAMTIKPDLDQKVQILNNAVETARSLGIETPKAAVLAAVETVNPAMEAATDAALLAAMNNRGQITGCIVDGPLAFDNAVSAEAARQKGLHSPVAGNADILLVPAIETGNSLYKSFIYFGNARVGGIIAGARAPIVLTSRADTAESKLYSLAMAVCSAGEPLV